MTISYCLLLFCSHCLLGITLPKCKQPMYVCLLSVIVYFPEKAVDYCCNCCYIDGLVQERCISHALAMELCLSCTKPIDISYWYGISIYIMYIYVEKIHNCRKKIMIQIRSDFKLTKGTSSFIYSSVYFNHISFIKAHMFWNILLRHWGMCKMFSILQRTLSNGSGHDSGPVLLPCFAIIW